MQHIAAEGWGRAPLCCKKVGVGRYIPYLEYIYVYSYRCDDVAPRAVNYHFTPARLVRARNRRGGRLLELGAGVPCEFLAFSCNL
jgi:hypothetical protein